VFAITVPNDFGTKKLIWTLVANGHTSEVNLWLNPRYFLDPLINRASGNTPPVIRFSAEGSSLQGPPKGSAHTLAATPGQPVALTIWATDKAATYDGGAGIAPGGRSGRGGRAGEPRPDVNIVWAKYRGPGEVTFAQREVGVFQAKDTKAETTATFSAPGEYTLLATANDQSGVGGGGDQCCWTTAHVKVIVK
jgi:hypothetical protein